MSSKLNRLESARQNPKGWTGEELGALLRAFGFIERGTKHALYISPRDAALRMTVTRSSGEISKLYVRQAVQLIDATLALDTSP